MAHFNSLPRLYPQWKFTIAWLDTIPQHFDSVHGNGYWGGEQTKCVPINATRALEHGDWRVTYPRMIAADMKLRNIKFVTTDHYKPLYSAHCKGDFMDCTHYSYWPMLTVPIYKQLLDILNET